MKSEKEKLSAKTVDQLKASYKRMGGKLVNPDGKAKTKVQLINGIVMKNRLAGKGTGAKATTVKKKVVAKKTVAKKAVKKTALGQYSQNYRDIDNIRILEAVYLGPTNSSGARVKIKDLRRSESKTIPYDYTSNSEGEVATKYLNSVGIKIFAKGETANSAFLFTKDFGTSIKDKA
jgi:hypothetical protein